MKQTAAKLFDKPNAKTFFDSPTSQSGPMVPIKILLIDDSRFDKTRLIRMLKQSSLECDISHAWSIADASAFLADRTFDLILSDLTLPECEGEATASWLSRNAGCTPFLLLTSVECEVVARCCRDHGAQDYLVKSQMSPFVLEQAVRFALRRHTLMQEKQELISDCKRLETKLRRRNKRLIRLAKTAQRFVDNVSHEFRTPLSVLSDYAEMLREGMLGELNEQQLQFLNVIADRSADLNNMVNDMLDSSRLDAGILTLHRAPCFIEQVIEHVRSALQRKAEVRDTKLTFGKAEDLPEVFADSEKLSRIITNLVVNAIKFSSDPGRVHVDFELVRDKGEVLVHVQDNGPGIEPEQLEEIFNRFRQLDTPTVQAAKGFGLGLNIVKELVDLNFGEVQVSSTVGEGTRMSFSVPLNNPVEVTIRYMKWNASRASCRSRITVFEVRPSKRNSEHGNQIDGLLRVILSGRELVQRIEQNRWLYYVPTAVADRLQERIEKEHERANRSLIRSPLPGITVNLIGTWSSGNARTAASSIYSHVTGYTGVSTEDAALELKNRAELTGPHQPSQAASYTNQESAAAHSGVVHE
ncbi:MAG: ATP-binding protein [Fuerstiella sp.]